MPRVLVVEDHPDISQLYKRLLRQCEVLIMPDGEQACRALEESHWSLVILDMHLGKISGLDVLKRARALPSHASTPIVAISADDTLRKQANAAGADLWITKPVDVSRLSQFINTRLGFV